MWPTASSYLDFKPYERVLYTDRKVRAFRSSVFSNASLFAHKYEIDVGMGLIINTVSKWQACQHVTRGENGMRRTGNGPNQAGIIR